MPLRWWAFEERSPEADGRCQWDFPMLKQVTVLPELGTADPFAALLIHEVGLGGAGKAVDFASVLRMCTGAQADSELLESTLDAAVQGCVSLFALVWGLGPDQGVGESASVQHSSTATWTSNQRHMPVTGKLMPAVRNPTEMPAQGERWATPLIKPNHGGSLL